MQGAESAKTQALKDRRTSPTPQDIDGSITLKSMLEKNRAEDWPDSKAAAIEGYVLRTAQKRDGDYHIVIAETANESDPKNELIVEVTPYWQHAVPALAEDKISGLVSRRVRLTGWLFFDPNETHQRGSRWELHPVTDIEIIG
jgi:hypothetical protein